MTLILLSACIITPLDIAFQSDLNASVFDNPISLLIDFMFFIDIVIIFNTAFYDEEMDLIENR
jgi:hypothetical protein